MDTMQFFAKLSHNRLFEIEPFLKLKPLLEGYQNNVLLPKATSAEDAKIREQINYYIEGCLVGPTIVRLGMNGMFHKYFMESSFKAEEFHKDP